MENINNDIDGVPEGFEFRDEYMTQGFEIYDKMKNDQKRKKRLFIFFLGFSLSSILLFFYVALNSSEAIALNKTNQSKTQTSIKNTIPSAQNQTIKGESNTINSSRPSTNNTSIKNSKDRIKHNHENNKLVKPFNSFTEKEINNPFIATTNAEQKRINNSSINSSIIKDENEVGLNNTLSLSNTSSTVEQKNEENVNLSIDKAKTISTSNELASIELTEPIEKNKNLNETKTLDSLNDYSIIDNSSSKQDLILDNKVNKSNLYDFEDHFVKNQFYICAGLNTKYNYSSTSKSSTSDFTFSGGYNRNFLNKFSVGTSFEYFSVSNMNSKVEINETIYGYRASYKTTEIMTKSLQYLAFTPEIGFKFNKRHFFYTGLGLEFLMSGKNQLTVTSRIYDYPTTTSISQDKNYIAGFKKCNQSLFIGYNFSLNRNFSIGCKYNFGLTDISINSFFIDNNFDRNNRILFNLKFNLN